MHIQWEKSTYKSTLVQIMEEKTSLPASELISPTQIIIRHGRVSFRVFKYGR